jgi:purine-nucleoside phosphorylase
VKIKIVELCHPSSYNPLMNPNFVPYRKAAAYLQERLREKNLPLPQVGIICGSGLSELSDAFEGSNNDSNDKSNSILYVPYGSIPGFPKECTVSGHKGEVAFGFLKQVPTMCFRGRFHSYEGHDMKTVVLPVYVMRCLGVKVLIVTNAAGGLNPSFQVGDVCCVDDHMAIPQLAGKNPLIGPNDDDLGPRFPPTSNAYSEPLRMAVAKAANDLNYQDFVRCEGSCYCFVSGPMYESRAECRFLRSLGGDMVGMSTIPEVVAAHHCDIRVLCLSLITNKVIMEGHEGPVASHQEVLEAVEKRSKQMQELVKQIVTVIKETVLPDLPDLKKVSLIYSSWRDCRPKSETIIPWISPLAAFVLGGILANASNFNLKYSK